jgi:hypothetical protein
LFSYKEDLLLTRSNSAYFVLGLLERRRNRPEAAEASFIEAQNLWLKGDQTRLHPFNAGCLYKTGVVCLDQGKVEAAVYVDFPFFEFFLLRSNPSTPQQTSA